MTLISLFVRTEAARVTRMAQVHEMKQEGKRQKEVGNRATRCLSSIRQGMN
jgi:hypothetical protein